MLHSDLAPEHECDGELIELTPTTAPVQRVQCPACGTEFEYQPDREWVRFVLPELAGMGATCACIRLSKLADRGSTMVKPGWEAASGPALSAWEASSMDIAPAPIRT